jgi:hypothetical protein
MKMFRRFLSPLVAFLFMSTLLSQAGVASAAGRSGKGQDTVSKVVEINRQALAQMQAGKYEAARDALWGAITILSDANLSEHAISARTHVHLAAVYMTGFNDRTKAIKQFVMALKIDPNIKITPQVETAALDEAFDAAHGQTGLATQARTAPAAPAGKAPAASTPAPAAEEQATPASGASAGGRRGLRGAKKFVDREEPAPPARVPEPFYCPLPDEVPPKEDILVRCVTQKQPRKASATVFYREKGAEDFTPLPMTRSPKGWLTATVPGAAVTGTAFQYYLEAKIPGTKEPLTIGSADGPNLMPIVDGAATVNNTVLALLLEGRDTSTRTEPMAEDKAPLEEINRQYQIDEDLRRYHRRLPGSFFFSIGGGAYGSTYHGAMSQDSHDKDANGNRLQITGGYSLASLFQLLGEIGYQFNDKFAMSLQARFQYTPLDSISWKPEDTGASIPPSYALAFFLRGQYAFFTGGNFQAFGSGVAGFSPTGPTFLGYVPRKCTLGGYGTTCPPGTGHSDTVSAGPVAVGVGVGVMYHLERWVAIWVEARGLSSFGPIMLLGEYNLGLSFALKFEKSGAAPVQEGPGGWERPPDEDKPPADAPPSE